MDLKQLGYFVRVAEAGGFTRAARELGIAQPALSRQIRMLEVELGHSLLARNGRGATPTEAGKLLLEHSRGILHQVERAREDLGRIRGTPSGRVAIGLPPTLAKVIAVPLTRAIRKQMPEAEISLSEGLSMSLQEWLRLGRLDIALLYNVATAPDLETDLLREEELFLITKDDRNGAAVQTIRLKQIAAIPLVIPNRPNTMRVLLESELAQLGLRPRIALEVEGVATILDLVAEGAGAAVLPRHALSAPAQRGRLRMQRIVAPALRNKTFLATSARRTQTLTQRRTIELIRATVAKIPR
ncbi:MAG: LysR substrate-binding domain-containing protein [Rudaea sp.]|uniref:LysR substrate-binding domain-containing protein n=1 Tax=Rudaea sp. TaxID=2136325 RepID=UPI0039E652DA